MFWNSKKKKNNETSITSRISRNKAPKEQTPHVRLIDEFEVNFKRNPPNGYIDSKLVREVSLFKTMSEMSPDERAEFMVVYAQNLPFIRHNKALDYKFTSVSSELFSVIIRRKTNFTPSNIIDIFDALGRAKFQTIHSQSPKKPQNLIFHSWAVGQLVNQLEKSLKLHELTETERELLKNISNFKQFQPKYSYGWGANVTKARDKLRKLISKDTDSVVPFKLTGDQIGEAIAADLAGMDTLQRAKWDTLFHDAATASGSKPTKKLQSNLNTHIKDIGLANYKREMHVWLQKAAETKSFVGDESDDQWSMGRLNARMTNLMKGLVWGMARFHDDKSLSLIAKLTEKSFERLPGIGPAAPALGNACIYTLANSKGLGGVAHLSRLKLRIKQNNTQKLIQKHIETQAAKQGLKAAEIEDMAAPDFDLQLGHKSFAFKDYSLKLAATSPGQASLTWHKPDGTIQKSVPSFVKDSKILSATLKKARDLVKDIKKASAAQRDRIDRLYTEDMSWEPEAFGKYYLNHGLIGPIARKLVWQLSFGEKTVPAIFNDERWESVDGKALKDTPDMFQLWHPIMSDVDEVIAWRARLEVLEICQPFKQAYREVYILTDAEVNTRVYSNRMAAHILKQHQFNTLSAIRGWKYQLLGAYDDGRDNEVAVKPLPPYGLFAEFWIDELNDEDSFNDSGIWDYVATDQVRFKDADDNTVNLIDVPALVLSEILRDADLFVGVASVGNDPTWADRGGTPRTQNYWQSYSFGDLNETAKTRKTVLENLLPRLKIRDIAKIDGKFLIVQGKRHSYKIHIGSGNILIQPADRYLCIVPGRGKDKNLDNLFLPFEGDRGLSVVLSKAFMLAEDDKIKDATILSQL